MYKCLDCKEVFEEPKEYSEDRTPYGGSGEIIEHYTACPYCGGAYKEAFVCEKCGEYFTKDELNYDGLCDDCVEGDD